MFDPFRKGNADENDFARVEALVDWLIVDFYSN